ncbi:hypothetical protein ONZ45_g16680 [Pleurotus djamor]|nr:hypothetical protein ONZ45_g16680 [Pleurotus djamor]
MALRPIYRRIQWIHPVHTAENLFVWQGGNTEVASLSEVPKSLVIAHHAGLAEDDILHTHRISQTTVTLVNELTAHQLGYETYPQPPPLHVLLPSMSIGITGFPSVDADRPGPLCISNAFMGPRITSFTRLTDLSFFDSSIPESVYHTIFSLPQLRRLSIEYCTLPALTYTDSMLSSFANLPITDLTLRCFSYMYNRRDMMHMLLTPYLLCTASNIRTMKIDWTRKSALFFAHTDNAIGYEYTLSTKLTEVDIRMPHEHLWPKQDNLSRRLYTDALALFLFQMPTITKLTLTNKLHAFHISAAALPRLTHLSAPLSAVYALLGRPLTHVHVSDVMRYHQPFTACIEALANSCPQLQSLGFLLPAWEDEILYVISDKFSNLRELCMTYVVNNPTEYTLLSMAHRFLFNFPKLETVRVFKPVLLREINQHMGQSRHLDREIYTIHDDSLGPGAADEEDVKELIMTWKKPCPTLKEIQFEYKSVWKKSPDGSGWVKKSLNDTLLKVTEAMELKWGLAS